MTDADLAEARAQAAELLNLQRAEDCERLIREALARRPTASFGLATPFALLMQGRYREGFREFECRSSRRHALPRQLPYPEWDGPLMGRRLLVWCEQGLGDEIQIVRFIPRLRELGASKITLACSPSAVRAFQQVGADLVISREGHISIPKHDYWVMAWSLPHRLGLTLDDISGAPYLKAAPLGPGGIGLVERGNPKNHIDRDRSIPDGLLQSAVPQGRLLKADGDIYDSLCRVAALDLLITVDTSWAHMAGALGVPCWLLLPSRGLDWRWMRGRSDTPWYDSLRLFRQRTPGDWQGVLREVAAELVRGLGTRSASGRPATASP